MFETAKRLNLAHYAALFPFGILLGALFGAAISLVNFIVSPFYFTEFFRLFLTGGPPPFTYIATLTVIRGVLQGTAYGSAISLLFTLYTFTISHSKATFALCVQSLERILTVTVLCGLVGAFYGVLYALTSPYAFYDRFSGMVGSTRLRYVAVHYSIMGIYPGCVLGLIVGCIWFKKDWNVRLKAEAAPQVLRS